ncbi:hypothetical protein G6F57_022378 [Rhizopus arrhizus]|nr:hypothetical protein G6F57_022378 [Rhizopus arrhizus]
MAEATVVDHVDDRVGRSEAQPQGVEVGQGAERGTGQQGRAAMAGRCDGSGDGATEHDLESSLLDCSAPVESRERDRAN